MNNNVDIEKVCAVHDLIMPAIRSNKFAKVAFRKKDGTLRTMTLHRSRALEATVKGTRPDATAKRDWTLTMNGMLVCEELTNNGYQWRTVNLATTEYVAVGGQVHNF